MASSGSFNTSAYSDRYLTFSWSIKSQSIANNQTVINWALKGAGGSTTRWYMAGNFKVVINGTTVYSSSTRIELYNGTTVASGTATIKHNNDGSKTFSASAEAGIYTVAVNCKGSGSWALDAIPRYATVSQSLTSKTETTATIKWTSDATIDYIWYSSNNGSSWTGINVADGTSGSYTISGLSANTTYQVKTRVRRKDSQLTTDSSALAVTTYAYPYANSMPNFTIGNTLKIGVYNPLGRTFTIAVIGADDSELTASSSYSGTSVSGFSNTTYTNFWYASIPNAKSGTYKVKITYGSQVSTKTGGTYTINESACKPSISGTSYKDTKSSVVAITQNDQNIVRNQSIVQYIASGLTAQKSASVASCKVVVNNKTYNLTLSGDSATGGNAMIDSGTDVSAVFTVTDSRGLTASKTITVKMFDWTLPSAIIMLERVSNFYSETNIMVDADYSSVDGKNAITITYKAKKSGTSSWTVTGSLDDNIQSQFVADNEYEWQVQVTLTDSFGGTTTYNLLLSRGMPIIYFDRLLSSVGINCFPKEEKSLEVNGVNLARSVMTRSLKADITDLSVSTYTTIPLNLANSAGDKLTATDDGGILIGANVSKVLVSARITYKTSTTNGFRHVRIVKNSPTTNNTLAWNYDIMSENTTDYIAITPMLANVSEGDVIYLSYYVPNMADTIQGNAYGGRTSMTVEVIQ